MKLKNYWLIKNERSYLEIKNNQNLIEWYNKAKNSEKIEYIPFFVLCNVNSKLEEYKTQKGFFESLFIDNCMYMIYNELSFFFLFNYS